MCVVCVVRVMCAVCVRVVLTPLSGIATAATAYLPLSLQPLWPVQWSECASWLRLLHTSAIAGR